MRAVTLTLAAALLLVGCGGQDADDSATDPGAGPTAEPTVGSYPSFDPDDYTYTLQVEPYRRLTINDVIDAAHDTGGAQVHVTWPTGQDYSSRVAVDRTKQMIDEEIGDTITDVEVTG